MSVHLVVDLEDWTRSDQRGAVRTLAAVRFDPDGEGILGGIHLDLRPTLDEQIARGRTVDPDTVAFWARQPCGPCEPATFYADTAGVPVAMRTLDDARQALWDCAEDVDRVWCRGPDHDFTILRHLFGDGLRWRYWQQRDLRTLDDWVAPPKPPPEHAHNAWFDASGGSRHVQAAVRAWAIATGGELGPVEAQSIREAACSAPPESATRSRRA